MGAAAASFRKADERAIQREAITSTARTATLNRTSREGVAGANRTSRELIAQGLLDKSTADGVVERTTGGFDQIIAEITKNAPLIARTTDPVERQRLVNRQLGLEKQAKFMRETFVSQRQGQPNSMNMPKLYGQM